MTGQAAYIIRIREYAWFDWLMFLYGPHVSYPDDNILLGQYLGPTLDVGPAMCAKILKKNGKVVPRSTLRTFNRDDIESPVHKEQRRQFVTSVIACLGPAAMTGDFPEDHSTLVYERYADNEYVQEVMADDQPEELAPTPELVDTYFNTELMLPRGSTMSKGRFTGRKRDEDDQVFGRANNNPILDTRTYLVHFDDGEVTELTSNVIYVQMYAQCDPGGNTYVILDDLTDHRKSSEALSIEDQNSTDSRGRNVMRRSTAGWKICCQWKDVSTSWEKLCDLKESHPV